MKNLFLIMFMFSFLNACGAVAANSASGSDDFLSYPESAELSAVPKIKTNPPPMYWPRMRVWQGIPSIEVSDKGRLWTTWYSGNTAEGAGKHFVILSTSGDGGATWKEVAVYDPSSIGGAGSGDPNLWKDKDGKINWILNLTAIPPQIKDRSVWYVKMKDAEKEVPAFETARLMANGLELNKPTSLKDGSLIIPADKMSKDSDRTRFYISKDGGKTSVFLGAWSNPNVVFSEHMTVERKDGSLWCLARGKEAILQGESRDGGKTWQTLEDFPLKVSINTRFCFARLKSGNLILIANDHPKSRSLMTAFLSEDEGKTWPHKLLLDERNLVSYPDAAEGKDGFIYVAYDRGRYSKDQQEILFAKITEADIKAGKLINPQSKLKGLVSNLAPYGGGAHEDWETSSMQKAYKDAQNAKKTDK